MITALDHFVLICPDLQAGADTYQRLLGRKPDWVSEPDGGAATALFRVDNTALELIAPAGDGEIGDRLRELLDAHGPKLTSLAFASDSICADREVFARRGLSPSGFSDGESVDTLSGEKCHWSRFRCDDAACAGLKTFILQRDAELVIAEPSDEGTVHALDHIVIFTPNPDRALALYGTRLGLDFRLDRTAEQWKTRFLFFRTGGLIFEVVHRLDKDQDPAGADKIWGLTWTVDNLEAAHQRLSSNGFDISEIRAGRKPGSRVFTVRDGTLDVPTLFIAHEPR
ncbi:MAG: VOC family protein [Pseudomonadota bacterium]